MNKLPRAKRVQILSMLCEGSSMRSISRVADVSINTVDKLLQDAGEVALAYHDKAVRGVKATRVQCDEMWSFVGAKAKNVPTSKRAGDPTAGDCWTGGCYASLAETGSASLSAMSSCFRASCSSRAFTFTVVAFAANERKWAACRW